MPPGFPGPLGGGYPRLAIAGNPSSVSIPTAAISTSVTGDLATIAVGLSRYIITAVYVESLTAAGTLALGTIDIRTATAGGGASVLTAPTALASLTAANIVQSIAVPTLSGSTVLTAANLTLRQTVVSANAGTIAVVIVAVPVP